MEEPKTPEKKGGEDISLPWIVNKNLTIVDFGKIEFTKDKFHTKEYIYPIGFKSTKKLQSWDDPDHKIVYTSEIIERGMEKKVTVSVDFPRLFMFVQKEVELNCICLKCNLNNSIIESNSILVTILFSLFWRFRFRNL